VNETAKLGSGPRKPIRANGRRRYEVLLDAAERLLLREGPGALTIQHLAQEAMVPMASIYHFFPDPSAVAVGLSERYLAGMSETLGQPIDGVDGMAWQEIVATLIRRGHAYYAAHPYAQRLILGSDHSWRIRGADLEGNAQLAVGIAGLLSDHFPGVTFAEMVRATTVAISINDALFTLSIFENGSITEDCVAEATLAVCSYFSAKFPPRDTSRVA
jgi:AcrR family transcriptional regulator